MTDVQPITVLMIDDDEGLANLMGRTLRRKGMTLVHAATGDEGLRRLGEETFDVVLLDHYLEGETGLDILPSILKTDPPPPVIYMTSSDESAVAVAALKAGAADYMLKDVSGNYRELLAETVSGAVRREEMRREKLRADIEVHRARDRAEALLREVNHRVANSLSLVSALVSMQERALGEGDHVARAALNETSARIAAIARVHRHLYISGDARAIGVGDYLTELIGQIGDTIENGGPELSLSCAEEISLSSDKAVSLGVVATELVTNAIKYAFPDGQQGEIRVTARMEDGHAVFCVEDSGIGFDPENAPQGSGLGTRIIDAMCKSLGASLTRDTSRGTAITLRFTP